MQNPSGDSPLQSRFGMSELSRKIYQTNPKLLAKIMELEAASTETSLPSLRNSIPVRRSISGSLPGANRRSVCPWRPRRSSRFRF